MKCSYILLPLSKILLRFVTDTLEVREYVSTVNALASMDLI